MNLQTYKLTNLIKHLLLFLVFAPLMVFPSQLFPYVSSKALFFRVIVEAIIIIFLLYVAFSNYYKFKYNSEPLIRLLRNPLFIFVILFFISAVLSTIFAVVPYRAFWGDVERGEGLWTLLHYLFFMIATVFVFERNDWILFFKISLIPAFLTAIVAILQYFGVTHLPYTLVPTDRPGSFFENPAMMGSYLVLMLGVAALVFWENLRIAEHVHVNYKTSIFWRVFSLATLFFSILAILMSNTRGAVLGMLVGSLFVLVVLSIKPNRFRAMAIALSSLVFLGGGIFFLTRDSHVWQSIPGLNRLAIVSLRDNSVSTRLLSWKSGFRAFEEKYLFGWGPENYKVAYNLYYNPEHARYEEAWFDRAHNKIVDIAVTQGVLGLISYFGIFVVLFYYFFRKKIGGFSLILAATTIAYFVQNLVLFDTPVSYFYFFGILGFVMHSVITDNFVKILPATIEISSLPRHFSGGFLETARQIFVYVVSLSLVAGVIFIFYFYNYIPFRQMGLYQQVLKTGVGETILKSLEDVFMPYNYAQRTIRSLLAKALKDSGTFRKNNFDPLNNKVIVSIDEVLSREPNYEARDYIALAEIYTEKAKNNPAFFDQANQYTVRGFKLAPKRHEFYYISAYILSGEGRNDEAIKVSREAVALVDGVARAHYYLGINLVLAGRKHWIEAERELALALDIGFNTLMTGDIDNMSVVYKKMMVVYIAERNRGHALAIARRFREVVRDESLRDELDVIIDLVDKERWEILGNL